MRSVRHPFTLACLFTVIVAIGTSGISALPWASNVGCQDFPGTRDADVSLQVVPLGIICNYQADSTGPSEVVVRAASIPGFVAWLVCIAALVGYGIRRRENPLARGVVTGVVVLGAFGFLTTAFEMSGALMMLVIYGTVAVAVLDAWLWPSHPVRVLATALMVPFVVAAAWFLPGAYGWEELADVVALAAAAGATALGSRSTLFDPARLFAPLP
jgi:hypothetical protein